MDQTFRTVYKPIQHDQIRLVKFGHNGDRTSTILENFYLGGPIPPYHALSYTWIAKSSGLAKYHIPRIADQELPVLESLQPFFEVLFSKGSLASDTWWWIDSICIDLANVEERGQQVQLMGQIYRKADMVVFWLPGEASDDIDRAIDFIELLNENIRKQIYSHEEIRSMFQRDDYRPHWAALTNFFQQRWWTRIWTLQEYAIPSSVMFWYGTRTVSRTAVEGALMAGDQCTGLAFKGSPAFRQGFNRRRVQKLYDLGQKSEYKLSRPLVALVAYGTCLDASDDRDRLYGIRALATDADILDVDYSLTVEEVYQGFAKSFIQHYKSLDIICFASLYSAHPGSSLPSWVPDWRAAVDPLVVPFMVSQSARTHIGNLRPPVAFLEPRTGIDSLPRYAASKDSTPVYRFEGSKLLVHGTILDTLDGLTGSNNTEFIQSSDTLNSSAVASFSPSGILCSVCRSLVFDRKDRFMRYPMPTEEFLRDFTWLCAQLITTESTSVPKEFQEWFDSARSLNIHGHSFESILRDSKEPNINSSTTAPNQDEYIMDTFFGRFFDTVVRMSLRLTVTCSGRIGMAAKKANKGDLVCVLYGCSVPILLRPSGDEDNTFTLVGECFIDGFMEGAGLEQRNFEEREFCIK
ncbi:heterokaryon incompatibility protein-domain-containing protein [Xylaria palmicola]|nr:heterokaryon incompatibility protein-domain-containing protein [Xylaria palmicola]